MLAKARSLEDTTCFQCGEAGHKVRECLAKSECVKSVEVAPEKNLSEQHPKTQEVESEACS